MRPPDMSTTGTELRALLGRLENYYDSVPRAHAATEEIGAFTLFVAKTGQPFYARPRLKTPKITMNDVYRVLDRQTALRAPRSIEWVAESTPSLAHLAMSAGMDVQYCPLLVLSGKPKGEAASARMLGPADIEDLILARAAVGVGFEAGGTERGREGLDERDAAAQLAGPVDPVAAAQLATGATRMAAAYSAATTLGPVGGGSHSPLGDTSEITGVAVLPAFRRQGLAAALSHVLATDAISLGMNTVFCSAQTEAVARIYRQIGFTQIATACIATAP